MKALTDLTQSKRLVSILPIESADMFWADGERPAVWNNKDISLEEMDIPAWSLVALLQIMPRRIYDKYDLTLGKLSDNEGYVCYGDADHFVNIYIAKSDLIDACVDIVLKLYEKKLL